MLYHIIANLREIHNMNKTLMTVLVFFFFTVTRCTTTSSKRTFTLLIDKHYFHVTLLLFNITFILLDNFLEREIYQRAQLVKRKIFFYLFSLFFFLPRELVFCTTLQPDTLYIWSRSFCRWQASQRQAGNCYSGGRRIRRIEDACFPVYNVKPISPTAGATRARPQNLYPAGHVDVESSQSGLSGRRVIS